ncbi:MAG: arginine--tRNA ligase, partial [Clostridiales bacterium]
LQKAKAQDDLAYSMLPEFIIELPRDESHGDFATNAAMLMAKEAKRKPREIAQIIADNFPTDLICGLTLEIAGPGFINFRMPKDWLNQCLSEIIDQGKNFGSSPVGQGKKIQVEFVSANPTGELHMGNARGAAIGDTLASLLAICGYEVEREFYVNDAGNQIQKFGASLEARYLQILGEDIPFPEDGYHGEDIKTTMEELIAKDGDKYKNIDSALRQELFIKYALAKKLKSIKETLLAFGVKYDVWFSEQSLHDSGAIKKIVNTLQNNNRLYRKEDALWLDCQSVGEEKDEVLVRSNGVPTYYAADIAYHDNKFQRGFDTVINIWGADHHGHVARMKDAMEALGYDKERLQIILMQLVRLYRNGEILRMSKRTGTYVTLAELMEEVGKDAARFFFVMRSADSQMDFDLDLAVSQSADNPVYYVQYAHARICSILASAKETGYKMDIEKANLSLLQESAELALIRKMADFPDELIYAAQHFEPHRIAAYVQELASAFHHFYTDCRVLGDDRELSLARLTLAQGTANIIKSGLNIMGVSAPEKM